MFEPTGYALNDDIKRAYFRREVHLLLLREQSAETELPAGVIAPDVDLVKWSALFLLFVDLLLQIFHL